MVLDDVVIACISGLSGVSENSGITMLRDTLQTYLSPLGVKPENIFRRSWHHSQDGNVGAEPWTEDLNNEINNRTANPSYLAIIGHSYGGWAACRLSKVTNREPDFIGLIDPVFGRDNVLERRDYPRGKYIINWHQNNFITYIRCGTGIPCFRGRDGIMCGFTNVPGAVNNIDKEYMEDWERNIVYENCGTDRFPIRIRKRTSHTELDAHKGIHRDIYDKLSGDISKLISSAQQLQQLQLIMTLLSRRP
ncbi:hypothetical protein MOE39_05005 [Bacillus cereus]|uniref:hypothetical protein n=1 Tax=Bacillus cereus TaxID=1396 RepID=UPI002280DEB1|nr:hypothetical protein [Bacillus cereus]